MSERCNASNGRSQCRCTCNLTRTLITVHREPYFMAKLPEFAIVLFCPKHLCLSVLEGITLTGLNTPASQTTPEVSPAHAGGNGNESEKNG